MRRMKYATLPYRRAPATVIIPADCKIRISKARVGFRRIATVRMNMVGNTKRNITVIVMISNNSPRGIANTNLSLEQKLS